MVRLILLQVGVLTKATAVSLGSSLCWSLFITSPTVARMVSPLTVALAVNDDAVVPSGAVAGRAFRVVLVPAALMVPPAVPALAHDGTKSNTHGQLLVLVFSVILSGWATWVLLKSR